MKNFFIKIWPIFFILMIWLIFSSPYFLKELVPFPSKYLVTFFPPWSSQYGISVGNNAMPDVISQIYPWKRVTIASWKMGQVPMWNPYSFAGTPHAANYQSAVFSPFNLLFFVLREIDAWSFLILLQPLLAGLFMYAFLRSLVRSQPASLIGSIAFMFCGFMVVWMAYGTLGYAVLWLPLILYAIQTERKLLLTASIALSFLSGHFQMSLYVFGMAVIFFIFKKRDIRFGLFLLLGLLLASPQLNLSYNAYSASVRSLLFQAGEIIPWNYLITLFAPDFFGNPVTRNDWFGHYAEWASFIGVIPLLLALYTIFIKKSKEAWLFWIVAAISLLLATPSILTTALFQAKIPVLSVSAASRIIVLFSFSLSVLAVIGLDGLTKDWRNTRRKGVLWLGGGLIVFLLLVWGALIFFKPLPIEKLIVAKRNFILPSGLALVAVGLAYAGFFKNKIFRLAIVSGFVFLTAADLLRFAIKWMPFDPREYVYPPMNVIKYLQDNIGNNRMFGNFGNELASGFFLPSLEGYDALYKSRYGEFISALDNGTIGIPQRSVVQIGKAATFAEKALQLLGVKYYVHKKGDGRSVWAYPFWNFPHYKLTYSDEYFEVYENTEALPRAFLASEFKVETDNQRIIDTILSAKNPQDFVVLEKEPNLKPQKGEGNVLIEKYLPNEVIFNVNTSVPKLLFLSDTYDPGWHAFVDGAPTPLYRADYAFRAVSVPAGEHTIRMVYWAI